MAAPLLDLSARPDNFLVFRDAETSRVGVLYKRRTQPTYCAFRPWRFPGKHSASASFLDDLLGRNGEVSSQTRPPRHSCQRCSQAKQVIGEDLEFRVTPSGVRHLSNSLLMSFEKEDWANCPDPISLLLWSAATMCTGFSNGLVTLIILRAFATGAGESFYYPSATSLIGQFHHRTRARGWPLVNSGDR